MISIIIPTLDEEKNIGKVIDDLKKFAPLGLQIIIVDNGSRDRTIRIAKEKGIETYQLDSKGKGRAMRFGGERASGEILVFIDGDGSYFSESIAQLIKPILEKNKDIVYGSRFLPDSQIKIGLIRYIGNKIFSFLGSILYKKTTDFLTGFFAIKKEKFLILNLKSKGFEIETEIFVKACQLGFKMGEIPIRYIGNKESKLRPWPDGIKILKTLLGGIL